MRQFDALLRQGLMDANLAQYENVLERADGREADFSPRYCRERMRLLADPWGWERRQPERPMLRRGITRGVAVAVDEARQQQFAGHIFFPVIPPPGTGLAHIVDDIAVNAQIALPEIPERALLPGQDAAVFQQQFHGKTASLFKLPPQRLSCTR